MESSQRFVKLQDQYYEVTIGEKGLQLVPVDAMKYLASSVEKTVLGNEVTQLAEDGDNIMQKIIDQAREELMTKLKSGIKETVLASLGFEKDSWHGRGFKVDHCNGRMSTVTQLISKELEKELLSISMADFTISNKEREELMAACREDFLSQYKSNIRNMVWKFADKAISEDLKEITDSLLASRKKQIADMTLEALLKYQPKKSETQDEA